MPSPFPGMDPYLEGPQWMSVHTALSVEIARQLSPLLPSRYVARPAERLIVAMPETEEGVSISATTIYPDAFVTDTGAPVADGVQPAAAGANTTAPLVLATVIPEAIPHVTVEIRDAENNLLVTAIEVLSPTNKRGEGREEYLAKRRRVLLSTAHLLEIDLLRSGQRVPTRQPLPRSPYFLLLGRSEKRPLTEVWPIGLDQPLPSVPVPLLPGDVDAALDLQQALTSVYDTFRYDRTIDYAQPPAVPLGPEEAAYAEDRLSAGEAPARNEPAPRSAAGERSRNENAPAQGRGGFVIYDFSVARSYLTFFALGFADAFVVFFETGFFAAAIVVPPFLDKG